MKLPLLYPKKAAAAALAGALVALAVLPGCKKAARPGAPPSAKPAAGTNAAGGKATNIVTEFVSVFDDSPPPGNKGRDPFNPDSTNRNPVALAMPRTTVSTGPAEPQFKLQGVGGSPGRYVAVISNHILTVKDPPETFRFPGGGTLTLKVVEIGSNYADITVEGIAGIKRLTMDQKK